MSVNNNDQPALNQEKAEKNQSYILKVRHKKNFTVIDNKILYESKLSAKATCYLCIMISFPDDWKISLSHLATLKKDGIDAVESALKELKDLGYVYMIRPRNERGHLLSPIYLVSEIPMTEEEFKKCLPQVDSPQVGFPRVDNPPLLNTNNNNTNMTKKQKDVASEDAPFISNYFFKKLKEIRPKRPEPNWYSWNRDIDLLMRQKELSRDDVIILIDFVMDVNNTFVVESPASLKKKYEKIADHIEIEKKRKVAQQTAKKDPRMAETIKTIQDYTSKLTAGTMGNDYSFIINPDGGVYHTIEKRNYPRNYDKFMETLKDKGAPESMIIRIKERVNKINYNN